MASSVPATNNNARQPNIIQGGQGLQLVPAPQGAYFQGVQPAQPRVNPNYKASAARWTGGIQLACGVVSIILGIANVLLYSWLSFIGTGIWTGLLFYTVTGILGIVSVKKSRCVIISYMVMSILSSVAAGGAIVVFMFEAVEFRYLYYYSYNRGATIAVVSLLLVVAGIELVTAITAAAFCCAGTPGCCAPSATTAPVICFYHAPPGSSAMPPGMVAFTTTGQQAAPGAPSGNNFTQQPFSMVQYPAGQPPMQWQPQMAAQPPVGHQAQNGPMTQTPAGEEKPPPYN